MQLDRGTINKRLHAISISMCGDRTVLDSYLAGANVKSTKDLSDKQAMLILKEMQNLSNKANNNVSKAREIIAGTEGITAGQRAAISKLSRYILNWSKAATFSYILQTIPALRSQLSAYEIEHSKLGILLQIMKKKEANLVIKRLDFIKQKSNRNGDENGALEVVNND